MELTIQEFSKRTGLPPSKLRFYDKKGLLQPFSRSDNGYRVYSMEQIHLAKMVDSLRKADIGIQDIRHYTEAGEHEKKVILDCWKKDLDKRLESLHAARKYVGGMKVENTQTLMLSKWEKDKFFVWQRFESERSAYPFREHFVKAKRLLEEQGIPCSEQVYLRNEKVAGEKIIGEVGFEVSYSTHLKNKENIRFEKVPPTLFAVMQDCRADDAFLCFSYIQVVIRYGFQPAGNKIERYANIDSDTFDYLIPLVK
ncbi:MerR family transcriptional regulator [Bacillus tianshenii]|uniref:helix-turn-helix domain-containing protein n=1 Tax=Sutcliffiella tianshenii TaxID=1463404 RepID=UPI001CD43A4B|nr:MerR family transcriptional regulator [Bacillus tianshenii]MCA1320961.1 MerR family transcriptional regulator [Bacillus tianshenii]